MWRLKKLKALKKTSRYPDLVYELFLVLLSKQDCIPPKVECCPKGSVAHELTGCGQPKERPTLVALCSLGHLDHQEDLDCLSRERVKQRVDV